MSINLTDEIEVKTKKGKLGSAKQIFLEGDTTSLQKEHEDNQAHFDTLDNRSSQMEESIKNISVTGGASVASAVTYDNTASGLEAVNVKGAVDELATKNKSQDSEISKKANSADVTSHMQTEQSRVNTELGKKFNKENILQESGEAEDKVMSQKAVSTKLSEINNTTNKNVFSANAEINAFIKECYIENWSGGDLYFTFVNTNDNGKVSIFIRDFENNWFIAVYKQPLKDFYISEKDGTKLYIVIDKNIEINYFTQGINTNVNKVSSKAFSLINSPMIKEKYFTDHTIENTNTAGDITSTKLSWKNFIYYKMNNRTNLLTSWKNEQFCKLEQFIVSLKVSYKYIDDKEKVEKYLSHLYLGNFHLAEDGFWFNLNNLNESLTPSLQWILYNIHFCDKKEEGIQSYTVTFSDYTITVIVNWNYYFKSIDPVTFNKLEITNYLDKPATSISVDESINNINKELDKINSSIVNIKNVLPNLCSSENSLSNVSFSKFEFSNGKLNIVASGSTDSYSAVRRDFNIPLKAGHKYCLAYKVLFKDKVLLYNADVFQLVLWATRANTTGSDAYVNGIRQPGDIKPTTQECVGVETPFVAKNDGNITTIELRKYNNTKTTDKILDVEISYIMLLDVTELGIDNYQLREILLQKDSFFTDIQIFKYYPIHQLYYNMKLRSLGDSLPETVAFQPWIANELRMKYSTEFEHNTKQIEYNGQNVTSYRSTWGSTRVAPVITSSTNERFMANASIYMRAKSLKYDMPDVLIILAGYNDPKAGLPYIDGGTYVQPADYGINDVPYTGDEIDLVSDKTQTAPSFGASYRGMLEQIIKDNPRCRIILCGVPRGSAEANKFGKEGDWNDGKNKVIEKIAKEYGYPFVNLADLYGVNKFNYEYLTKDNLHFSNFGGRRVAMEILAKAF